MKMDEYELELLDAVEETSEFKRVENFEDELLEAFRYRYCRHRIQD